MATARERFEERARELGPAPAVRTHPDGAQTAADAAALDPDLLVHDEVWAAAGTPDTVFPLTPEQLEKLSGGTVTPVC